MSYDLYFRPTDGQRRRPFSFGLKASVGVRGPHKLINRWMKCLLTRKGSDPYAKTEGTDFVNILGMNYYGDVQDVLDVVSLAIEDCNNQMMVWDRLNQPPPDEQLAAAKLTRIEPRSDDQGFDMWVEIRNAAGRAATLQIPSLER